MAKRRRNEVPGMVSGGPKGGSKGGPKSKSKGKGSRQSIASARKSGGDRTTLIIGSIAIIVIIAIIVVGLVMNSKNTAIQEEGYGNSTKSIATVDDNGMITVSNGDPSLTLDFYEDAMCPFCADLEQQYGQQVAKAVDDGDLIARYRTVDFLDSNSSSGDYSTRALAAMVAVAKTDGDKPGVFMTFHTALFSAENQPEEVGAGGTSDLSNGDLADLAKQVGASDEAQQQIRDGAEVGAAKTAGETNLADLKKVAAASGRSGYGTPTVAHNGLAVNTNDTEWLSILLPGTEPSSDDSPTTEGN